jgi:ADP-ribose pyrophosphatase YjhB (NUDIX family)
MREAVCALIYCNTTGRLLSVKRKDSGKFSFPGGKIDPGEGYKEALSREVLEETGRVIVVENNIGQYTGIDDSGYSVTAFLFIVNAENEPTHPFEENLYPAWISMEEFKKGMAFIDYNSEVFKLLEGSL